MFRLVVRALFFWLFILTGASADGDSHDNEPNKLAFTAESGARVTEMIEADVRFKAALAACPADIFGNQQSYWDRFGFSDAYSFSGCAKDAEGCFKACASGEGKTCFRLARALQRTENLEEGATTRITTQQVFAFGCAAGYHGACTNRGAAILNGDPEGDPKGSWPQERISSCSFRSFELACQGDTGWGCAMLGQAQMRGRGTEENRIFARSNFMKVCKPNDSDHASCRFAQRMLKQLDE